MSVEMAALLAPFGVACVDGRQVRLTHPVRLLQGWELKAFSLLHTRFAEVLLLDADNVPVLDPAFLFDDPVFREKGAVFWPDFGRLGPERAIWRITGIPYRDEPEFESGQILVDRTRCWEAPDLHLRRGRDGVWRGRWLRFERMPIELTPQPTSIGKEPMERMKDEGGRKKREGKRQDHSPPSAFRLPPFPPLPAAHSPDLARPESAPRAGQSVGRRLAQPASRLALPALDGCRCRHF